ncbi:hypothetical protein [Nostoc sp. CALU 546]
MLSYWLSEQRQNLDIIFVSLAKIVNLARRSLLAAFQWRESNNHIV